METQMVQSGSPFSFPATPGCSLLLLIVITIWVMPRQENQYISARRILPLRCTVGQPFPVVIEVFGRAAGEQSIILKEMLPASATVLQTFPVVNSSGRLGRELKWLKKIDSTGRFTYLVQLEPSAEKTLEFSGTIALAREKVIAVQGNYQIMVDYSHWADGDGDSIISDDEILHVFDHFADVEGIDIDLIEKIWIGSGYRWDSTAKVFEVLD